jgi:hypothetical protein
MTITILEALQQINNAPDVTKELKYFEHDSVLIKYLRIFFGIDYKFHPAIGDGYPEMVRLNRDFADGISDSTLRNEHRQFYIYSADSTVSDKKIVLMFSNMLEQIHFKEADMLVAIKDGKFGELFPNITYEQLMAVFPDSFPVRDKKDVVSLLEKFNETVDDLKNELESVGLIEKPATVVPTEPPKKIDKRSKEYRESIGRK